MVRCVVQLSIVRRILSSPHKNPGHGGWADRQQAGAWPLLLLGQLSRQLLGAAVSWVVHIGPDWGLTGPQSHNLSNVCWGQLRGAGWRQGRQYTWLLVPSLNLISCTLQLLLSVKDLWPHVGLIASILNDAWALVWFSWLLVVVTVALVQHLQLADNLLVFSSYWNSRSVSRRFTFDPKWRGNLQYKILKCSRFRNTWNVTWTSIINVQILQWFFT